jgi:hypothetical protein
MIEESPKKAPGAVIMLGSLWLVAAGGLLVWSVSLLFVFGVIRNFAPGGTDPLPPAPPAAQPLYLAFEHYVLTGSILGALALLGLYGGVQFLRLKPWAYTFFEVVGWMAIALSLVLGLWWSHFWVAPQDATGLVNGVMHGAMRLIAGLIITVFYVTFPGMFVWLLRSRWVRPAFSSGGRRPWPSREIPS